MSDTADDLARRPRDAAMPDPDTIGLIERIAERSGILTLDAALEAARSIEHGANPAREAAQLREIAARSLEAFEDIVARTPR